MEFLREMAENLLLEDYEENKRNLEEMLKENFEESEIDKKFAKEMSKERNKCRKAFVRLNFINIFLKSKKLCESKKDMAILGKYIVLAGKELMGENDE